MKTVKVSNNILVNPYEIGYIEQKLIQGRLVVVVCVMGREFELEVSVQDFMDELNQVPDLGQQQFFAG